MGIESVVDNTTQKSSNGLRDVLCSTCEMAVVWAQSQLKDDQKQDQILDYINGVKYNSSPSEFCFKTQLHLLMTVYCDCSSAKSCLVQWENQLSIVIPCLLCQIFPLQLVERSLTLNLSR